ncbi:MAG TPA: type III pantothenate kinase [Verrucomicrobiae bacterium]|jgi:type III pantothenate kinase|nr:type III pantothenate kinase [Verrucomicrobiae bacterium]
MLILLDIGNTSVTYGLHQKGHLKAFGSVLFDDIPKKFKNWVARGESQGISVVLSSVVPKNTQKLKKMISRYPQVELFIAGKDLPVEIKHNYKNFKQLGIDRKVNVYGAVRLYEAPLLVIDFGTAITLDYISKQDVFKGGMIIPGPGLAFQALIQRAALIPSSLRLPQKARKFLGRNTYDCISSGVLEGYGAMIDGLVQRFKSKLGNDLKVLATGGFSTSLQRYAKSFDIVDPQLSVKSLHLLFRNRHWTRA